MSSSWWSQSSIPAVVTFSHASFETNKFYGCDSCNIQRDDHELDMKSSKHCDWSIVSINTVSKALYAEQTKQKSKLQKILLIYTTCFGCQLEFFLQAAKLFELNEVKLRIFIQNFVIFVQNFRRPNFLIDMLPVFCSKRMILQSSF